MGGAAESSGAAAVDSLPAGRPEGAGGAEEEVCAEGGRAVACLGLNGWGTWCRGARNSAMARLSLEPSQLAKAGSGGLRWMRRFQEGFSGLTGESDSRCGSWGRIGWIIFIFWDSFADYSGKLVLQNRNSI